ncbi:hypothetical protein ACIQI7_13640 [Kitasatospora sp. NPDC092039]|uniref:hypothetical protein n=1 Tax=Kitasatospora sp. NPDC092039 TaxID=3364086 RepID=UPI0038047DC8
MSFDSYHWWGCRLDNSELDDARAGLASGTGGKAGDHDAFRTLLRSGDTVAVGIALDHYHHADSTGRYGAENPFADDAAEVLDRARKILESPPSPASTTGAEHDGADHASALLAMLNLARPEDSGLIASALRQATTANSTEAAALVAGTVLEESATLDQELVDALSDILFEDSNSPAERLHALMAFANVRSAEAARVAARAIELSDFRLQAHAALILARRHLPAYRTLVERVVASWPKDAPFPAPTVLDLLGTEVPERE